MKPHEWTNEEPWDYELTTGRKVEAHGGIIGIDSHIDIVYEGYDSPMRVCQDDFGCDWTPAERAELADYMIGLWSAFKARG